MATNALNSGKAYDKFCEIVAIQGGDLKKLPLPVNSQPVLATQDGWIHSVDTEKIGIAGIALGAGRKLVTDKIDAQAGIQMHKKIGDSVRAGELLFSVYPGRQNQGLEEAKNILIRAVNIEASSPPPQSLIFEKI